MSVGAAFVVLNAKIAATSRVRDRFFIIGGIGGLELDRKELDRIGD